MLHWNSWWVQRDGASPLSEGDTAHLPQDPATWTPEGWISWQLSLWNRSWEASLAWWQLYGVTVPVLPWLQAVAKEVPADKAKPALPRHERTARPATRSIGNHRTSAPPLVASMDGAQSPPGP